MSVIYVNSEFLPAENALIPVMDRGFRFGDGVFETVRVHCGIAYRLDWHLERLQKGLKAIKIPCNLQPATCNQLIQKNNLREGFLRIAISRGVGSQGYLPKVGITPTIVIEALPLRDVPESASLYVSQYRKIPRTSLPVQYKLAQGLNSTLARMEAQEQDCFEALQLNSEDMLCEASSSNLFWVKGNRLYTPSLETGCLEGSTRAVVMGLEPVEETAAPLSMLQHADEVFLTNGAWGILPIISLKPQGWKWPIGENAKRLRIALQHDMEHYAHQHLKLA